MFPPMSPVGERVRHDVETRERARLTLTSSYAKAPVPAAIVSQVIWLLATLKSGAEGFVAVLGARLLPRRRSFNRSANCNPC